MGGKLPGIPHLRDIQKARKARLPGLLPGRTDQNIWEWEGLPDRGGTEPEARSKVLRHGTNCIVRGYWSNIVLFLEKEFFDGHQNLE